MNKLVYKDFIELCKVGEVQKVEQLIANEKKNGGVSLKEARDAQGFTALHWCSLQDRRNILELIIAEKIYSQIDDNNNNTGQTPLHWACIGGNILSADILLKHDADPKKRDNLGYTPVIHAAQNGKTLAIHYLRENGMGLNEVDKEGHTALHWSVYQKHHDTMLYLINHSGGINNQDNNGCTALHWSAMCGDFKSAITLVESRADINITNKEGLTPFMLAETYADTSSDVFEYLGYVTQNTVEKTYPSSSASRKMISCMIPFSVYPLYYWSVSSLPFWWIIPIIMVTYYMFNRFKMDYFWSSVHYKSPFPAAWACATIFYLSLYELLLLIPNMPEYYVSHRLFVCFIPIIFYLFYKSATLDPGVLAKHKPTHITNDNIISIIKNHHLTSHQFCVTCTIRKPLRSKHCRSCDTCIARFDHHCPWINNCVGANNHPYFIGLLITWSVMLFILFLFHSIYAFAYVEVPFYPIYEFFNFVFSEQLRLTCVMLCIMVHFGWITFLLYEQIKGVISNRTLNQKHRHSHNGQDSDDYDRGFHNNLQQFTDLYHNKGIDWYHYYNQDSMHQRTAFDTSSHV